MRTAPVSAPVLNRDSVIWVKTPEASSDSTSPSPRVIMAGMVMVLIWCSMYRLPLASAATLMTSRFSPDPLYRIANTRQNTSMLSLCRSCPMTGIRMTFLSIWYWPFGVRAHATNTTTRTSKTTPMTPMYLSRNALIASENVVSGGSSMPSNEANSPAVSGTMYQTYQMNTPIVARMVIDGMMSELRTLFLNSSRRSRKRAVAS